MDRINSMIQKSSFEPMDFKYTNMEMIVDVWMIPIMEILCMIGLFEIRRLFANNGLLI